MPNEWTNDMPGMRPRKVRKASKKPKKPKGSSGGGNGNKGTTVGLALLFALPALAFFGALGYCIWMRVAA